MNSIQVIMNILPYEIYVVSIITFFMVLFNLNLIRQSFKHVDRRTWRILMIIIIAGLTVRMCVMHAQLAFFDEQSYASASKNLLLYNKAAQSYYIDLDKINFITTKQYISWTLIQAVAYFFFGLNNYVGIYFTSLIGALSILFVFMFTYLLFENKNVALLTSFTIASMPLHIFWSGTSDTNIPAFLILLITFISFLIYYKVRTIKIHLLAVLFLIWAIQIRYEYVILIPLLLMAQLFFSEKARSMFTKDFMIPWIIFFIFIFLFFIPQFSVGYYAVFEKYSFLKDLNVDLWLLNYENNQPIFFLMFLLVGFFASIKDKSKQTIFIGGTYLFFMVFYTLWSGTVSFKFFFINYIIIFIFQSRGILLIKKFTERRYNKKYSVIFFTAIILISLFFSYYNLNRHYYIGAEFDDERLSTKISSILNNELDNQCYLLSNYESGKVLTNGAFLKVVAIDDLPKIRKGFFEDVGCLLYYEGEFCLRNVEAYRCAAVHKFFDLELYKRYKFNSAVNSLYNVSLKKEYLESFIHK